MCFVGVFLDVFSYLVKGASMKVKPHTVATE